MIYFYKIMLILFCSTIQLSVFSQTEMSKELNRMQQNIKKVDTLLRSNLFLEGVLEVFDVIGLDDSNREATFQVCIITQKDRWLFRDTVNVGTGPLSSVLPAYLELLPNLKISNDIIAVGTASEEGTIGKESKRAMARAREIAKVVKSTLHVNGDQRKIYTLNLGQYKYKTRKVDTSDQRRVIIVGTIPGKTDPK